MRLAGPTWLRILALMLLLLLQSAGAPTTTASPDGLVFTVDINRPAAADHDGDRNYRTLTALFASDAYPKPGEHDAVLIAPGIYPGDLAITIKGLQLRATAGPEKTVIRGQVTLTAPDIVLEGLSIDAAGADAALRLDRAPGARFQHGQLTGARLAGLQARESFFVSMQASRITANPGRGIWIGEQSQGGRLDGLQVQGNGRGGIYIKRSDGVQITASTISLNGGAGVEVEAAQGTQIRQSLIQGNAGPGIQLMTSGGSYIDANELIGNASFGILLRDSSDNALIANVIHDNDRGRVGSGGIGIEGGLRGAHGNRLERNRIEGQVQPEAAGIALRGRVTGSEITKNTISQNYRGITFAALGSEGPRANRLIANQISASKAEGLLLEASGGANLIQGNEIAKNLQTGLRTKGGGRDQLKANAIHDNGAEGIWLSASPDDTLSGDRIVHNGRAGLRLDDGSDGVWLENAWVAQNGGDGLLLNAIRSARVQSSSFSANQGAGIRAQAVQRLHAQGNDIHSNREAGINLNDAVEVELAGNRIHQNRQVGIAIAGASKAIELSENFFAANGPFGLKVEPGATDLAAQRNWWGTAEGPRGVPLGGSETADRVDGVSLAAVFPWLPAPPDRVSARSVRGLRLERIQGGEALDARDVAGAKVQLLSDVKGGLAIILLARPSQAASVRVGSQLALALAYVQIAGASSGSAEIALAYNPPQLPSQTSSNRLQLFHLGSDGSWHALESHVDEQEQLVSARMYVSDLRHALIALAVASAASAETTNQETAPQPPPTLPKETLPQQPSQPQPTPPTEQPAPPKTPESTPALISPQAGETLLLPAGEYTQDIRLDRAGVTLGSSDPAHPAVIHGHLIVRAPNVTIQNLRIESSGGGALEIRSEGAHILGNEIRGALVGVYLTDGARGILIRGNQIEENGLGLSLENVADAVIEFNQIVKSRVGGLLVKASHGITIARNDFIDNDPFNLKAEGANDLTAHLNWWGDPRGPQGTALGVAAERLFPWLTAPFAQNQQLATLRFTPSSAGERMAQFLTALLRLDLPRAWSALHDWASGTDTFVWNAVPYVRLRFGELRTSGQAILAQARERSTGQTIVDLVLVGLNPEKVTLMPGGGPSAAVQVFHFDGESQSWVASPTGGWAIALRQQAMNVWRWVLSP